MEKSYFFTLLWNKTAKLYRFSMIFDINQLQGAMAVQFVGTYFMYVPTEVPSIFMYVRQITASKATKQSAQGNALG